MEELAGPGVAVDQESRLGTVALLILHGSKSLATASSRRSRGHGAGGSSLNEFQYHAGVATRKSCGSSGKSLGSSACKASTFVRNTLMACLKCILSCTIRPEGFWRHATTRTAMMFFVQRSVG